MWRDVHFPTSITEFENYSGFHAGVSVKNQWPRFGYLNGKLKAESENKIEMCLCCLPYHCDVKNKYQLLQNSNTTLKAHKKEANQKDRKEWPEYPLLEKL